MFIKKGIFFLAILYLQSFIYSQETPVNQIEEKGKAAIEALELSQNFILTLTGAKPINFPVGIKKEIDEVEYIMAINSMKVNPQYTELEIFLGIKTPEFDDMLVFGSPNIKLSHEGGIIGDATLGLLSDFIFTPFSDSTFFNLKALNQDKTQGCFVTIDCDGFKELSIDAEITFPRSKIIPINDITNEPLPVGNVKGRFKAQANSWNNLIAEVNISPFEVVDFKGFAFSIQNAVIDLSDIKNSTAIIFPPNYQNPILEDGLTKNLWKGIYIQEAKVVFPKEFLNHSNNQRPTISISNLIIDNTGFSGFLEATNILQLGDGSANNWAFSVTGFEANIMSNKLTGVGFKGQIIVPIAKETTPFDYEAYIDPGDVYRFVVSNSENVTFPIWQVAKLTLYNTSYLKIEKNQNQFIAEANLSGVMEIAANSKNQNQSSDATFKLGSIFFENLNIKSQKPYISIGGISLGESGLLANLPFSVSNIKMYSTDEETHLNFDFNLNIIGDDASRTFSAKSNLTFIGGLDVEKRYQLWKFNKLQLNAIVVNADMGAIKLNGGIFLFEDEPTYGKGFYGKVIMTLDKPKGVSIAVAAMFGKIDGYRYWFADGMAKFPGINIGGPVRLTGLGGGAYQRMKQAGTVSDVVIKPGASASGIVYAPDKNVFLGFRASVTLDLQNESALNSILVLEMEFNNNWGVNFIKFSGAAKVMSDVQNQSNYKGGEDNIMDNWTEGDASVHQVNSQARVNQNKQNVVYPDKHDQYMANLNNFASSGAIGCAFLLDLNFQNDEYHGQFEVFINVANGLISGAGNNHSAGKAVIHIDKNDWYFYIGTPNIPVKLKLDLKVINASIGGYFCMGTTLPSFPPPPANVSEILGLMQDQLSIAQSLFERGNGFMFGASLDIHADISFLIVYAKFDAGLGFDVKMQQYDEDVICAETNSRPGINGWYAKGQAYAYLAGEFGVQIKFFGKKIRWPVFQAGVAVLLQAKLPNPSWFRGWAGGYAKVLGFIKVKFRLKVEFGKYCTLLNADPFDEFPIISDIVPNDKETEVDVFTIPQCFLNVASGKTFELYDDNGNTELYRVVLEYFKVTHNGKVLVGEMLYNTDRDVLSFKTHDILPPESNLVAEAQVSLEKRFFGQWLKVKDDNGQILKSTKIHNFKTGKAPPYIPKSEIVYCYPVIDQYNYFQDESRDAYIKMKHGRPDLFVNNIGWHQELRLVDVNTMEILHTIPIAYNANQMQVEFKMPTIKNNSNYHLVFVNVPPLSEFPQEIDNDITETTLFTTDLDDSTSIEVDNKIAESVIKVGIEKNILDYSFRTSKYNTLREKFNNFPKLIYSSYDKGFALKCQLQDAKEIFSEEELIGNEYTSNIPLIESRIDINAPKEFPYITDYFYSANYLYTITTALGIYDSLLIFLGVDKLEDPLDNSLISEFYKKYDIYNVDSIANVISVFINNSNNFTFNFNNIYIDFSNFVLNLSYKPPSTNYPIGNFVNIYKVACLSQCGSTYSIWYNYTSQNPRELSYLNEEYLTLIRSMNKKELQETQFFPYNYGIVSKINEYLKFTQNLVAGVCTPDPNIYWVYFPPCFYNIFGPSCSECIHYKNNIKLNPLPKGYYPVEYIYKLPNGKFGSSNVVNYYASGTTNSTNNQTTNPTQNNTPPIPISTPTINDDGGDIILPPPPRPKPGIKNPRKP